MTVDTLELVRPAWHTCPEYSVTLGPEVADLNEAVGFAPDPEQRLLLNDWFAVRPDNPNRLAAFEAACIVGRQNMKTGLLKQAALGWLFITDQRLVIWSAHEFSTASEAYRDLREMIEGSAMLSRRVKSMSTSPGAEVIELMTGQRLKFKARTHGGGRGLTGDKVVLDEGFALRPHHMGALIPTLSARPDPQVAYASSAGLLISDVLRGLRARGRPGSQGLAYAEWSVPMTCVSGKFCDHLPTTAGCTLDDLEALRLGNPQIGRRIGEDWVRNERRGGLPQSEFVRERGGWWEDPLSAGGALDYETWLVQADPGAPRGEHGLVLGVDVAEDRSTCIAVGWERPDGRLHLMLTQFEGRPDTGLTVEQAKRRLVYLARAYAAPVVVGGPSKDLVEDLEVAGVQCIVAQPSDFADACGRLADATGRDDGIRHGNQPELNASIEGAEWRSAGTGGERAFLLKDRPGIGPAAAVARVVHGLANTGGVLVW